MKEHECSWVSRHNVGCVCELEQCVICGVTRSVGKCSLHHHVEYEGPHYYLDLLRGEVERIPRHNEIGNEFKSALQKLDFQIPLGEIYKTYVLDVGAGAGSNATIFMNKGYTYEALEINPWAAKYIEGNFGAVVYNMSFEDMDEDEPYDAIIASHVLEHVKDAREVLKKMFRMLNKNGIIYLLVPDDTDLGNPDHLWFFTESTIKLWLAELGFSDVKALTQQVVAHEKFIYVVARKV